MNNIDEIVVGQSNTDFLSKMEEELNKVKEQEMEEEKKPLDERVKSKNWKTRKNAYTEILQSLKAAESRTDKIFLDFVNVYTVILDDPHASAQETALEVIKQVFENYEYASNLVPDLFKVILEKCCTSSRAVLKVKARDILVLSVEVSNESNGVMDVIRAGLDSKNPKTQAASVNILTYLISQFGSFKIEYRSLIQNIEKLGENSSPQIRSEVLDFFKELYKWIKDAIKPYVNRLKDTQQKELEKAFDEISGKNIHPVPSKFLKSDKNKDNDGANNDEVRNKLLLLQEEEKMFKNTEAIELFAGKFNEAWCEDLISKERKWSEKKEMLELFISASNNVKIYNSSKSHIIVAFIKSLKDNNINVSNSTILAINNLAKGLRKDLTEAKEFLIPLVDKLKEKREKVVADVFACLDSLMTHCLGIDEVVDDLIHFISNDKDKSQTVQMKERFCVFIEKTILKTFKPVLRKVCKPVAESMFKLSDDPSPDVRNAALTTIGVLKFRIGDMPISKILSELCDLKKKKVDEAAKNAVVDPIYDKDDTVTAGVVKINPNNKKVINTNNITNNNSNQVKPIAVMKTKTMDILVDVEMTDLTLQPTNFNIGKVAFSPKANMTNDIEMMPVSAPVIIKAKPVVDKSTSAKPTINNRPNINPAKSTASTSNLDNDLEANEDESNMSNEDVENLIKDKVGSEVINGFNDSKWENRKNAFSTLSLYVLENSEDSNRSVDLILRFMKLKLKDYKENNFNIFKEALSVIQNLCETCSNFSKRHCIIIIKKTCEKIGDAKLKGGILNVFMKFMEYHGPKYIANILLKHMTNNVKGPNVLKEFASFMEKVIEDFGISTLPVKELVDFGKFLASNVNPQLRNAATSLICVIYKYLGPNIKKFLNDIKEATLKVIELELEKVTVVTNQKETNRELKGTAAIEAAQSNNGNLIENLFPRHDISKKINGKIIKDLNEGKWQAKKEALDNLEKIFLDANMRIMPNGLNELITCLKNKLDDGNKNMVRSIIQFITKLLEALGSNSKLFAKTLINPILRNLSDKMNLLREDVIKCLEKWSEMIGFENVLIYCPTFLVIDNFELRTDLMKIILKYKQCLLKFDCKELIPGVLSCLIDKMPSIRALAEDLAKEILKFISINNFYTAMKDYKPAIAATIKSIIEKYSSLICIDPVDDISNGVTTTTNTTTNINNHTESFKQPTERSISLNQKVNIKNTTNNNISNINTTTTTLNNNQQRNNRRDNKRDSNSSGENDSKNKNKKATSNVPNASNAPNVKGGSTTAMPNIKLVNVNSMISSSSMHANNSNQIDPFSILSKDQILCFKTPIPLLINANIKINQKNRRLENENKLFFPNEFITQEFDGKLRSLMNSMVNRSYVDNAYSNDVAKFNSLFSTITATLKSEPATFFEVTDLWLKWILIRNLEMNNNLFFNNMVFEFIKNIYDFLKENECLLHETENKILIEILISKVFAINPQAKSRAKSLLADYTANLIQFDTVIKILCDKFNLIYDIAMKTELVDLIATISQICNYNLLDKSNIIIFVKMYDNVRMTTNDETMTRGVLEIIRQCYARCQSSEKTQMYPFLQEIRELNDLLEKPRINSIIVPINTNANANANANTNNTNNYSNTQTCNVNKETLSYNFSRSPILSLQKVQSKTDENSSKESLSIKLIDTIDQTKIDNMLNLLYSSNLIEKTKILLELNDIFTNKYTESVVVLEKNIDPIIKGFGDLIKSIFCQNLNPELVDILKYLLTVFYKAALTKDVIENCSLETIYNSFEEILRALLYEELESIGESEEGKKIIKSLNALILKLMENFQPTNTFVALIKLIQNYRGDNSRICSLSIKCLLKLSNIMPNIINSIEIERVLLAIYEFITDFEKDNPELNTTSQNEEMCIKILRTVIHEFIKIKNEGIWNYYKLAIERNNLGDKHLKRWIQLIIRSKNGISMPSLGASGLSNASGNSNFNISPMMTGMSDISAGNHYENELNFYVERINKCNKTQVNDPSVNDKLVYEVIAILKRNKLPIEHLKDKLNEQEYNEAVKIYVAITISENNSNCSRTLSQGKENISDVAMTSNKFISNFTVDQEKEKEISQINNLNVNIANTSFASNTNVINFPIKSLQEYRNRFHGITDRSDTENNKNTSPSPIKPNLNDTSNNEMNVSASYENRKQYMDNFMKNREMLRNNTKRDISSELRQNVGNSDTNTSGNNNPFDKLMEMKKRLEMLRSQKF